MYVFCVRKWYHPSPGRDWDYDSAQSRHEGPIAFIEDLVSSVGEWARKFIFN